jgi:hypothetical protein
MTDWQVEQHGRYHMRAARFLAIAFVLAAMTAVTAGSVSAGGPRETHVAGVQLTSASPGGPQGVAYLRQRGQRLTGWIVVWGLAPGSGHAWHVHGPNGSCTGTQRDPVASDDDLVADANGVAYVRIATTTTFQVIRRGFYVNVHELSSEDGAGPGITCGNIRRAV